MSPTRYGVQQQQQPISNNNNNEMYLRTISPPVNQQRRQTPANSISSSPPSASPPFSLMIPYASQQQTQQTGQSRRSISPDNMSHQDETPAPRTGDPRRTASLPQLFSRDFLSSLTQSEYDGFMSSGLAGLPPPQIQQQQRFEEVPPSQQQQQHHNQQQQQQHQQQQHHHQVQYPSYRRGSAPPVVLSVVTNSLADLDSLADELVSEPATSASASQLFNMPTVFPGSIKGSINEYW